MGTFLLFIILIIALILIFGISILKGVINLFFGRMPATSSNQQRRYNYQQSNDHDQTYYRQQQHHRKVFGKDEGEYVDFEEIKE